MIGVGDVCFFWAVFFFIWIEYGDLLFKYPYSVQMPENTGGDSCEEGNKHSFLQ